MSSASTSLLFVDLVLIIVVAQVGSWLAVRLGQPPVIGEILAGILLGPTIFGHGSVDSVFPRESLSYLSAFANVGVAIFMFVVGLEIDASVLRGHRRPVLTVSLFAYVLPFALGFAVGFTVLLREHATNRLAFALFLGAALSVTAFPVLARILADRGLIHTEIGQLGLASAAVDDVLAWCVLAGVIGYAGAASGSHWRLLLAIPFILILRCAQRPLAWLSRLDTRHGNRLMTYAAIAGALISGAATEWMGLHLIFGAFVFGVVFPRDARTAVEDNATLVSSIFLPAFFIVAGLRVDLRGIDHTAYLELLAIIAIAFLGKFGGAYLGARCFLPPKGAGAVAALMNTRGLTELIVLAVGLNLGLLGPSTYSLLVIMAVLTTMMTGPLLRLFDTRSRTDRPSNQASVAAETR
ncbi:cation:proton antiporter [Nocardia sp. NPDC046763]|uniref:cation:proton antiporter n=1 Tax=Nocardia sp. NPDC046763 TaxID=3155256 RepID=UPI0033FA3AD8